MSKQKRLGFVLYSVLAIGLIGVNATLIYQNHALKSGVKPDVLIGDRVAVGKLVRNLGGVNLRSGTFQKIVLPEAATNRLIILTVSSGCPACKVQQPNTNRIAGIALGAGWDVVYVSRDSMNDAAVWGEQAGVDPKRIWTEVPVETYVQLGLRSVPKIIAIGPSGIVDRVWSGEISSAEYSEVSAYIRSQNTMP